MKYLSSLFTLFFILTHSLTAQQQPSLAGDWKGYININGQHLTNKVHFDKQNNGYSGTIDIPQQGAMGLHLQKIRVTKNDSVFFEFEAGGSGLAKYRGHFKTDSLITGSFHQNGYHFPFKIHRFTPVSTYRKPLPYHHKDIIIKNDSIKIGGTLTWPEHGKANQLVVMISGSGAQTRDENVMGFKIFDQMADYLTQHGIATYRYDDRGTGESTGQFDQATLDTLTSDAQAIVTYFSGNTDHHFNTITLLGHSQGGIVAGKLAARDSLVDKLVLMSSPSIELYKVLNYQLRRQFQQAHLKKSQIAKTLTALNDVLKAYRDNKNISEAKKYFQNQFSSMMNTLPDSVKNHINDLNKFATNQANSLIASFTTPQMLSLNFYDPKSDLRKLHIPVLALFGRKDIQVRIDKNRAPMQTALDSAGISYQINVFKDADHLYQKAKSVENENYAMLPKHFLKGFLPTIVNWIKRSNDK